MRWKKSSMHGRASSGTSENCLDNALGRAGAVDVGLFSLQPIVIFFSVILPAIHFNATSWAR